MKINAGYSVEFVNKHHSSKIRVSCILDFLLGIFVKKQILYNVEWSLNLKLSMRVKHLEIIPGMPFII